MSMDRNAQHWHREYESLENSHLKLHSLIEDVYRQLAKSARLAGFRTAGDDRAETLIAAITQYLIESQHD